MPRPNKPIRPGQSLTSPVAASRGSSWSKHAGPENSDQYEPDGAILVDQMTHETVAEVDLTEAHEPSVTLVDPEPNRQVEPFVEVTYTWETERSIEGRTYHRVDTRVVEFQS